VTNMCQGLWRFDLRPAGKWPSVSFCSSCESGLLRGKPECVLEVPV